MKKFGIILLWLLCGFGGTYWASRDPRILDGKLPIYMYIMGSFIGPPTLITDIIWIIINPKHVPSPVTWFNKEF